MLYLEKKSFKFLVSTIIVGSGLFSSQVFAQYSTINPSMFDQSSLLGKVQDSTETFLYNLKPKFKTTSFLGFDEFRLKFANGNGSADEVSHSFLTSNGSQSVCNIKIIIQPDGRIFNSIPSNTPPTIKQNLALSFVEIQSLNNFKLSSLLFGCGLDNQSSPFGESSQEKRFSKINEIYKNGQIFNKSITLNKDESSDKNNTTVNAIFPSFYLLYRNNYADLLATSLVYKNDGFAKSSSLFSKYNTINKLQAVNLRQSKGIPQWESFNSYDIALKDNLFNETKSMTDKQIEDKVKSISHESVMMTYLLGQREQTEPIMDVQAIKQAAIIRTVQELDKDFNIRSTETTFNRLQSTSNNLAMKLSKNTVDYMKNTLGSVSGYNNRVASSNPNNMKAIITHIDKLITDQQLDKVASIEYDNMRKQYPDDIKSSLSKVNTVGFYTHKSEQLQNVYQNIYNEMIQYNK